MASEASSTTLLEPLLATKPVCSPPVNPLAPPVTALAPSVTPLAPPMTPIAPLFVGDKDVSFLNVVNVVATVNLECPLDLIKICLSVRNAEYNPKRFSAVIMKILSPRTTALVFASGKLVITGAKSEEQSNLAARKYARIIQKIGFNVRFMNFKIHNIVGSCDFKFPINLEEFVFKHSQFCSYEPELFPGLVFRMIEPRIVLLIFVNGKVVLTGAKERAKIHEALNNIYPILKSLKKQ